MNAPLPSGTVTFLFSDIEGSTRLWETHPQGMKHAVERHDQYITRAIQSCHGQVVKSTGDGVHAVFEQAQQAAEAALQAQIDLMGDAWSEIKPERLRVRMGLYTGEAALRTGDYYGNEVNRAARLMATGHGGQVLLSALTASLVRAALPDGASLRDLGAHRLRDLVQPERIYQLVHPALPAEFPPILTIDEHPNNLPVQSTSYVGREREMQQARQLLADTRLLTLIGPGGTGKTRLSLQLAAELLVAPENEFTHGVWLAEFGPVSDPDLVVETVAGIFNLRGQPGGPPLLELLTGYLREKKLLLLLDNCEHLIEACAGLADHLLRTCPGLKIIASSREVLGIYGETVYSVPSLSLPGQQEVEPEDLLRYEAVQLFVERARAAQPGFRLSDQNAPAVRRICRRLDGIPLALELAAARVKLFTVEQIAARLDDRFRLLTGGSRTALPRQQTLSALIDWSYDLLNKEEQAALRQLSVFTGGWSYDAAEYLCPDLDVLILLSNLVNKSLVIVQERAGESRYTFLETIRQYARDKLLAAGESVAARDRHLDYFLRFTADNDRLIFFAESLNESVRILDQLDVEYENIRGAVEWAVENRPVDALLLMGYIHFYIGVRASPREGERWIRQAIAAVEQLPPAQGDELKRRQEALARGWVGLGQLAIVLGESLRANAAFEQGIPLARQLEDKLPLVVALFFKTTTGFFMNDMSGALAAVEEVEQLAEGMADPRWKHLAEGTSLWIRLVNEPALYPRRDEFARRAARLNSPLAMEIMLMIGFQARLQGDFQAARRYLEEAQRYFPLYRSRLFETMTWSELGHLHRQTGNPGEARRIYQKTIRMWKDLGHRAAIANQLECFAFLARGEGDSRSAALLLGAAERLREDVDSVMTDYERPEYERVVAALRDELGEPAFSGLWAEGRALEMEQAVEMVVGEGERDQGLVIRNQGSGISDQGSGVR